MKIEHFIDKYPKLYHMSHVSSWPSIQEHGLLSTSALLDLFGIKGARRVEIEEKRRPEIIQIHDDRFGTSYIRDQKPLSERALKKCLVGVSRSKWLKLLNSKVYFWPNYKKVQELSMARAYRDHGHCLISVDTEQLVMRYCSAIQLTPINVGSTIYRATKRGPSIFCKITDFPNRKSTDRVKEVAVNHSVPDVNDIIVEVCAIKNGRRSKLRSPNYKY